MNTTHLLRANTGLRLLGFLPILLGSSCVQYAPAPLDLARDSAEWQQFSAELCGGKKHFSTAELEHIGLLLNPELNRARLTYARSTEVGKFAGLWEDPTLSADVERIIRGPVTSRSLAPGLSIPVTGLPKLAAKVAEQYQEADYWTMCATELEYRKNLQSKALEVMVAHARLELIQKRSRIMNQEKEQADSLSRAGEIDMTDYHIICRRLGDLQQELQQQETAHMKLHHELVALLGLHPTVGDLEISDHLPDTAPAPLPLPTADMLTEAPSVKALMAAYGAGETELKAEIRKQYPQLTLSPGLMREDKEDKVTLGVELNIPLWNRNREAIARSLGDRSLKAQETVTEWHRLLQQADALSARQKLAERHCRDEKERVTLLRAAMEQQEQLFAVGETTLPSLAEARHEAYQRSLNYLDDIQELLETQIAIRHLR